MATISETAARPVVPAAAQRWRLNRALVLGAGLSLVAGSALKSAVNVPDVAGSDLVWSFAWLAVAIAGGLILEQRPDAFVGRCFLVAGFLVCLATLLDCASSALLAGESQDAVGTALRWVQQPLYLPALVLLGPIALLHFPGGLLPGRGWAAAHVAGWIAIGLQFFVVLTRPGELAGRPKVDNPTGVAGLSGLDAFLDRVWPALTLAAAVAAVGSLVVRWRQGGRSRRQVLWLLWALGTVCVVALGSLGWIGLGGKISDTAGALLSAFLIALPPAGVVAAIVREQAWDIEVLVKRSLVLLITTIAITLTYLGVVTLAARPADPLVLLATVVSAAAALPVHAAARDAAERRLFGHRDDPVRAMHILGRRLRDAPDPTEALVALAAATKAALGVPAVELRSADGAVLLARAGGMSGAITRQFPLRRGGELVGELVVTERNALERLTRSDVVLVDSISDHLAGGVAAVRLVADVQHARQQLVLGREQERRQLRRDLHDGIGPSLATVSMRLALAQRHADPGTVPELTEIGKLLDCAAVELKRLTRGLRPPALDELGLVAALQEHLRGLPVELPATLVAAGNLDALPAAIESATYRIVTEAVANVLRHAGASHVQVTLRIAAAPGADHRATLVATISDDGVGMLGARAGVGLHSMRERAQELGGEVTTGAGTGTETGAARGTRVTAWLPI